MSQHRPLRGGGSLRRARDGDLGGGDWGEVGGRPVGDCAASGTFRFSPSVVSTRITAISLSIPHDRRIRSGLFAANARSPILAKMLTAITTLAGSFDSFRLKN